MARRKRTVPAITTSTRDYRPEIRPRRCVTREAARWIKTEKVQVTVQQDRRGRIIRGLEVLSRNTIIKTGHVDGPRGPQPGRLDWALQRTNVTTKLKEAKRFTVTIRGKDHRDKAHRIKHVVSIGKGTKPARAYDYLLYAVIEAMRKRGYRTQYNLEIATYSYKGSSKSKSAKLKQLHDVEIQVKVEKR